jgi:diguanylate cyclase (GGDEF)-like protein
MPDQVDTISFNQLRRELDLENTAELQALEADDSSLAPGACLVQVHPKGPTFGHRYPIGNDPVLIGRDAACAIHNPDTSVSRRHARIEVRADGRYHISDLDSRNGTSVNNLLVRATVLNDGDQIRIGSCVYRFLAGGNVEAEYHEELYNLSVLDPLTTTHNRRSLMDFLDREIARSRRHERALSLLLVDLDNFKAINDEHGHLAGDVTLRTVAGLIKEVIRTNDLVARYGGDEFAVVLPETPADLAFLCGERIRRSVAEHEFEFGGHPYTATLSVGVGRWGPGASAADLLQRADTRLYEAKRGGRNRVRLG